MITNKKITVTKNTKGICYFFGDIFPIQLIVTSKLSEENNLWLRSLTNDLKENSIINKLSKEYSKHEHEELYESAMNIIVRASNEQFKEANK